jgi:hypothetical protein
VRSAATSPVVQLLSEEGGESETDEARPLLDGELGNASGTDGAGAGGTSVVTGSGTVRIFRVLNGSFIEARKG